MCCRSRSTLVNPNAFPVCSDALSLDASRSKCVSYLLMCVLPRRPSIKMRCVCAQMRSRSTPVDPNASPVCSAALPLDACRSKCISYMLKCILARRLSIKMRVLCVQKLSRLTTSIQMRFLCDQMRSSSASVDRFYSFRIIRLSFLIGS